MVFQVDSGTTRRARIHSWSGHTDSRIHPALALDPSATTFKLQANRATVQTLSWAVLRAHPTNTWQNQLYLTSLCRGMPKLTPRITAPTLFSFIPTRACCCCWWFACFVVGVLVVGCGFLFGLFCGGVWCLGVFCDSFVF